MRSNRWIWGGEFFSVSHGVIWKSEIWNWISEKLFVLFGKGGRLSLVRIIVGRIFLAALIYNKRIVVC